MTLVVVAVGSVTLVVEVPFGPVIVVSVLVGVGCVTVVVVVPARCVNIEFAVDSPVGLNDEFGVLNELNDGFELKDE